MPLFSVLFGSPVTLVGTAAAAASVPIIIHLLNRRRFRIIDWAAMRFLLAAEKKTSRKLRIEQLLLLLIRILILVFIALAMASVVGWAEEIWGKVLPESFGRSTPSGRRTHKIIVVDGSFSMGAKIGNSTAFENARKMATALVEKSSAGDGFSVILMGDSARRIVPGISDNKQGVLEQLSRMYLPHGNANLETTFESIADLLRQSPGQFTQKEVFFFTDLQQATWESPQPARLQKALETINKAVVTTLVDVGQEVRGNLALTDLHLNAPVAIKGNEVTFTVTLQNYGEKPENRPQAKFLVGRIPREQHDPPFEMREVGTTSPVVDQGQSLFSFPYRFPSAGRYVIQVKLLSDDLELDNVRTAVLDVRDKVPILIVNGKTAANLYDRSSEFLLDAIDPYKGGPRPVDKPFEATVLEASQFADAGRGDLSKYDCVFFCDVPQLSPAEADRLKTHVKQRGGVVFCLGPSVNLKAYNDDLYRKDGTGLLPGRLLGIEKAPQGYKYHLTPESSTFKLPPLNVFTNQGERASLVETPFRSFIRVQPLESRDIPYRAPRTILSFLSKRDESEALPLKVPTGLDLRYPAIMTWQPPLPEKHERPEETLVRQPGRGRVILYTSTVNRDWTNWPRGPSFLWVMQELLRYSTAGRLREQTYTVGQVLEDYLPGRGGREATFILPGDRRETIDTLDREDFSVLRWVKTDQSGLYRATVGDSKREHAFAVNVPTETPSQTSSESDPIRITRDMLKSLYPTWDFQIVQKPEDARPAKRSTLETEGQPEKQFTELGTAVAHWLLLAALILIILEVILAWIFGHYSAVHEQQVGATATTKSPYLKWLRIGLITSLVIIFLFTAALMRF